MNIVTLDDIKVGSEWFYIPWPEWRVKVISVKAGKITYRYLKTENERTERLSSFLLGCVPVYTIEGFEV